jgi:chromosome segregation ATPase
LDSDENAGVAILNGVAQPQKHPVQELLDLEMELAGEQAALGALKHTMELLQENLRLFRRDLEQLKLKKERIEELEGQTRTKQTLIEELIKQNTQAKQDFDTKVRSIRGLSANKIGPIQHRVAKFVRELEDFVSKEVNTLERLDVKDLHVLSQERFVSCCLFLHTFLHRQPNIPYIAVGAIIIRRWFQV